MSSALGRLRDLRRTRRPVTAPPPPVPRQPSPAEHLDRAWWAAAARVRREAAAQGTQLGEASEYTAAWLALAVSGELGLPEGLDREVAQEWLDALLAGRAEGWVHAETGRPVVRPVVSG